MPADHSGARIDWEQVEPIAEETFDIWTGRGDREWARVAWEVLAQEGLTTAADALGRLRVHVRFLVLASFYRDWATVAFDEVLDDSPSSWLRLTDAHPFHVGQIVGNAVEIDDPEYDLDEAVQYLMEQERSTVVRALLKGFNGVVGLFLALWRSERGEDSVDGSPEDDAEILDTPTDEKLAAYEWIDQGCRFLGPLRFHSDYDGGL